MSKSLFLIPLLLASFAALLSAQAFNPLLTSLAGNTAIDLGRYSCGQPADHPSYCESITDYSRFTYDPINHQMLMFGGGHSATFRTDVDAFSFSTLSWNSLYPSTQCAEMTVENLDFENGRWESTGHPLAAHTYDKLVFVPTIRELVLLGSGTSAGICGPPQSELNKVTPHIYHFSPSTKSWSLGPKPLSWSYGSAEYDPISGMIVIVSDSGLWTYDPVVRVATKHSSNTKLIGYANNLIYYPPNDKFYYIARGNPTRVWEITVDRNDFGNSSIVEVQTKAAPTRKTEPDGGSIGTVAFHALDYDPINNVFVFIAKDTSGKHTWAYRFGNELVPAAPKNLVIRK
jgi:hypothetical protein